MFPKLRRRLRALIARRDLDRELDAEMRSHIELEARELERMRGLSPVEARRQASLAFGGVDRFAEEHRDARGVRWIAELWEDLRYSARALLRAPVYTLSAALVLALGIGASTAIFSAVDAVLLARLPYPDDEQLVRIYEQNSPTNRWSMSVVDFQAVERLSRSFAKVGALRSNEVVISAGAATDRLVAGYMSSGFLEVLGVDVVAGRRLTATDELPESPAVVVLGGRFANQQFGSAAAALDRTVNIDGVPHRVVGVLSTADARVMLRRSAIWPVMKRTTPTRRGPFGLAVIAKLRPGVTIEAAQRDLSDVSIRIFPEWQAGFQDKVARLTPYSLRETFTGNATRPMSLFIAAAAMVLLISISNVTSLGLVRSMRRWREIALRSVLGASRARLVKLVITESVLLAIVGATLGVAVGWLGLSLLQRYAADIPRLDAAHLDARATAIAFGLALVAGVVIGAVPAVRLFTSDRGDGMRDGTRAVGDGRRTNQLRAAFVTAEFALALPLLAASALLLNSLMRLQRVDTGFDARGLYTMRVALPSASYRDQSTVASFWRRVSTDVGEISGVTAAGFSTDMPPSNGGNNNNFDLVDRPVAPGAAQPTSTWPFVDAPFLKALGLPLLEGRAFTASDTGAVPVVLVTQSWAKRYYPDRSPVGRELISGGCTSCPHTVIVGVVGDATFNGLGAPSEVIFEPLTEGWPTQLEVLIRASAPRNAIEQRVRSAIRAADPNASAEPMEAMEDRIYESVAQPRHWATILVTFASAALVMAAVGIFGLLAYAVALRRREIGVRMALGAPSGRVVQSIVVDGMRFAVVGAAIGIALTVGASRWLRGSLYGVSALDPLTLSGVTFGMLLVALLASFIPARRAASIDPLEAMRPD